VGCPRVEGTGLHRGAAEGEHSLKRTCHLLASPPAGPAFIGDPPGAHNALAYVFSLDTPEGACRQFPPRLLRTQVCVLLPLFEPQKVPAMPFQRSFLTDQVAAFIRQGITSARWSYELPSELEMCRELHVSRTTLRKAIEQLVTEGLITLGGRRRHHRIANQPEKPRRSQGGIVRVLNPYSYQACGSVHHVLLDCVAERLQTAAGCRLEYEHRPALFTQHKLNELKRLSALPDTAAWLVFYSTPQIQRWFADQDVPAVIIGRLHENVKLPCVIPNSLVVAKHAAGLFVQRGHRHLVYFHAEITSHGDRLAAGTFEKEARHLGAQARVITYADPLDLRRKLDALLASRSRPTAFIASAPEHCLTIYVRLLEAGLRIPEDASIIATWDDEFLRQVVPNFACYHFDGARLGAKTATLLLESLRHGRSRQPRTLHVLPTFVPGETLGPIAAKPVSKAGMALV
jgi:hypothetical protein